MNNYNILFLTFEFAGCLMASTMGIQAESDERQLLGGRRRCADRERVSCWILLLGVVGCGLAVANLVVVTRVATVVDAVAATAPHSDHVMLLRRAHSHNDYLQPEPLVGALAAGFCSVEADVHLVDGVLRLGHLWAGTETLVDQYLAPLQRLVALNGGRVYRSAPRLGVCETVTLMVDVKTEAVSTWRALEAELRGYRDMLGCNGTSTQAQPAVAVVVSGNRPAPSELGALRPASCVSLDGRWTEEELWSTQPTRYRMVSGAWDLPWDGAALSAASRAELRRRVQLARARGLEVRFWTTPEQPALWQELVDGGVDWIGSDLLHILRDWMTEV